MFSVDVIKSIFCSWVKDYPMVTYAFLFGSRARGNYNEQSDIDIAIKVDRNIDGTKWWIYNKESLISSLQKLLSFKLDLELYDSDTPTIHEAIKRDGILLFKKI